LSRRKFFSETKKQGDTFYLAYDGERPRFHLVKWEHVRWVCSCGKGKCEHKFLVNELVFAESQQRRATDEDLIPHVEDDLRSNR